MQLNQEYPIVINYRAQFRSLDIDFIPDQKYIINQQLNWIN